MANATWWSIVNRWLSRPRLKRLLNSLWSAAVKQCPCMTRCSARSWEQSRHAFTHIWKQVCRHCWWLLQPHWETKQWKTDGWTINPLTIWIKCIVPRCSSTNFSAKSVKSSEYLIPEHHLGHTLKKLPQPRWGMPFQNTGMRGLTPPQQGYVLQMGKKADFKGLLDADNHKITSLGLIHSLWVSLLVW